MTPTLLPYPKLINITEYDGIDEMFCYIVKHYGYNGVTCLIHRENGDVAIKIGDWTGRPWEPNADLTVAAKFLEEYVAKLVTLMQAINLPMAQYYVVVHEGRFVLVDVQLSLNKFAGPGMLRDVFQSTIETQEIIAIEMITPELKQSIRDGKDRYAGDLVLKPSRFRPVVVNGEPVPLYIEVTR